MTLPCSATSTTVRLPAGSIHGSPCVLGFGEPNQAASRRPHKSSFSVFPCMDKEKAPPGASSRMACGSIGRRKQRLARCVLDLARPDLLHRADDGGRHRHVVKVL